MLKVLLHSQPWLALLTCAIALPQLAEGGRYSFSTPSELAKVVAPLVIVGLIFIVMLILLAVFYYQKKKTLCSCLCCREFCNKHSRMRSPSGDPQCVCITDKVTKPDTMCEACRKWKNSSGSLLERSDSRDMSSDGVSTPEVRICRCTIQNGCGSVMCKMTRARLEASGPGDMNLTKGTSSTKYMSTEEFLQTAALEEECNCPCTQGKPLEFPADGSFNIGFDWDSKEGKSVHNDNLGNKEENRACDKITLEEAPSPCMKKECSDS